MAATKRLTLLRHAKAEPEAGATHDRERPLAPRGLKDAPLMGQRLREAGVRPSLILTSPATRALQTARLVATELGYPLEFLQREADLYLASPAEIRAVLARQDDAFNDVIVCGHNPGLTDLANELTGAQIGNVPTCGVVVIEADIRHWARLGPRRARLLRFDYPKRNKAE